MCVCGRVLGFCISPVLVLKHSDTTEKKLDTAVIGKGKTKTADEPTNAACMREI